MASTHSADLERSSSQSFSITDAAQTGLDLTGDFTIEMWLKLEDAPTSGQNMYLVSKYGATSNSYAFAYRNNSGTPLFRLIVSDDGTNQEILSVNYTLTAATWTHVAVTFDASTSTMELFINAVSQGTSTGTMTSIFNGTNPFYVGDYSGGGNAYDGLISQLRVWDVLRSDTEIADNYDYELSGSEANLQGNWKFNNDATDSTTNSNDLTANNAPTYAADVPTLKQASGFIPKIIMF